MATEVAQQIKFRGRADGAGDWRVCRVMRLQSAFSGPDVQEMQVDVLVVGCDQISDEEVMVIQIGVDLEDCRSVVADGDSLELIGAFG